jgi:hypothetical protein
MKLLNKPLAFALALVMLVVQTGFVSAEGGNPPDYLTQEQWRCS